MFGSLWWCHRCAGGRWVTHTHLFTASTPPPTSLKFHLGLEVEAWSSCPLVARFHSCSCRRSSTYRQVGGTSPGTECSVKWISNSKSNYFPVFGRLSISFNFAIYVTVFCVKAEQIWFLPPWPSFFVVGQIWSSCKVGLVEGIVHKDEIWCRRPSYFHRSPLRDTIEETCVFVGP